MSVALIAIHALAAVGLPVSLGKQRRRTLAALQVAVRRRENKPHREEA